MKIISKVINFIKQNKKATIALMALSIMVIFTTITLLNRPQYIPGTAEPDSVKIITNLGEETGGADDNKISCDLNNALQYFLKNSSYDILSLKSVTSSEDIENFTVMSVIFDDSTTAGETQTWIVVVNRDNCEIVVGPGSNPANPEFEKLNLPKSITEKLSVPMGVSRATGRAVL